MSIKSLAVAMAVIFLAGCASIPQSIKGNPNLVINSDYAEISQNVAAYQGKEVRLGGKVLNVINNKNETLFEVAVLPLNTSAKPEINSSYQGRIIVKASKFIEPLSLKGHLVTVLGTIGNTIDGHVGKAAYTFLSVNLVGYQVWKVMDNIVPDGYMDYGFGPYWQNQWGAAGYAPYTYNPGFGWGWYPEENTYQIEKEVVR